MREFLRTPRAWILCVFVLMNVPGLNWGLPASDGWDNDGIAPRDFLAGLVETFTPGHYYQYPPVQLILLGVLTLPVTLIGLANAASLSPADVIAEMVKVPYMTAIALIARVVSLLMAAGTINAVSRMVFEVRGERASLFALAFGALNAPLVYYARTSNLDVPYMFFASVAMLALVRALARKEPARLRRFAVFAVLAVGTKDQAYALFLGAVPVAFALWIWRSPWAATRRRALVLTALKLLVLSVVLLFVVDLVPFNPSGFRARLHFLVGSASQDYVHYTNDWTGRFRVLEDIVTNSTRYYSVPALVLAVIGGALGLSKIKDRDVRLAALIPLLCAVSYTMFFNCVARRTDHRFVLPQMILLAAYGGIALDLLTTQRVKWRFWASWVITICTGGAAVFGCASVTAQLLLDPRYDAEAWLHEHVRPGDLIETHSLNVYLLRFPRDARIIRVGPDPTQRRNPMPGITEVEDEYGHAEARNARFIVVSEGWAWRYLLDPRVHLEPGRVLPPTQIKTGSDLDGSTFFQALLDNRRGFHRVHNSTWSSHVFPRLDFHASTSREIWIFERNPG